MRVEFEQCLGAWCAITIGDVFTIGSEYQGDHLRFEESFNVPDGSIIEYGSKTG
jgi:hypothetical protein